MNSALSQLSPLTRQIPLENGTKHQQVVRLVLGLLLASKLTSPRLILQTDYASCAMLGTWILFLVFVVILNPDVLPQDWQFTSICSHWKAKE